jgi:NAD(P)-dependent dehydrogenase (short-subunit alcohol dehydrogenase family)
MKVAILGGTKGMGRSLARLMAARGDRIALLGRDPDELQKSASDLQARGAEQDVAAIECDLKRPETFETALARAEAVLGGLDTVIVTAGIHGTQEELEDDPDRAMEVATVNYANTIGFCEHARTRLLAGGGGTLCVFSSVAGDRGRKKVVIYGSTKAGLSAYLEGLDHRYRSQGLKTVTVKPGFVRTGMTAQLDPPPFAGEPDEVAKVVVRAIDRGTPLVYAPPIWGAIMFGIKRLPRFVMRRVGF